jgi:hypothetical protein
MGQAALIVVSGALFLLSRNPWGLVAAAMLGNLAVGTGETGPFLSLEQVIVTRATARERAEQERARILEDARAAAERIRSDARAAVDQELRRARARLREETSDLSIQLAGELLRRELGERDRERLIDDFVAGVERGGPGA